MKADVAMPHEYQILHNYFIAEFEKELINRGVDTTWFFGYGYRCEDVKIGATFYFSYRFLGREAVL